ncbi:hypothetical protein K491DRAFT_603224 [Lophiostoma macrostomum CBS 122681]|uniref:Uncharacterized protein n=1 Tax=Lophiostoma macrostomum CBS 122681 TaxID=1314788 RepID=A0A6A6T3A7_9PLEO|nr:hypothetical protein K491DRAFT_603224 [Lophiostoma macrostomum CBS 122681]
MGNHQDHKLVHDTPNSVRYNDQRSASGDTVSNTANDTEGRGDEQSGSDEAANEDDEEDSSAGQEEEQDDEEDDPAGFAPSHVSGKGKGKRPAIRIEPAGDDSQNEDAEFASHEAGHNASIDPLQGMLNGSKKRTYSTVSNTSLLFGDDGAGSSTFPRPKIERTLSHSGGSGLLTYKSSNAGDVNEQSINFDDEDYSGVNMISEDESDAEKLEQQEATFIIQDEHDHTDMFSQEFDDARRLSLDSHGSDNIFDFAPTGTYFPTITSLQDVGFGPLFETAPMAPTPEPLSKRKFSDNSMKRVRFDDQVQFSDSSSSSSSELDSATFPDLFLEQDKLPPGLSQLMEVDKDIDSASFASSASEHSYWDVGQDETRNLTHVDPSSGIVYDEDEESSDPGSSGYETDMGDTTDEYDSDDFGFEAQIRTPRQKSILHRPSSAPGSKVSSPRPFQRSSIGPTRGIFIHEDSRQAIAVTNRNTRTVTFYRPRTSLSLGQPLYGAYSSSTSTANDSPRTLAQQMNLSDSEPSIDAFAHPFTNMNTSDIMLAGIFGSAPINSSLFADMVGPPEAFYPFTDFGPNGEVISDQDEYEYDDDDASEDQVNIADFMDFGSDVDETELEQDDDTEVPATPATSMVAINGSTPARPTPLTETPLNRRSNVSDAMLEHFDRAGVTAFRNNQNRYRDLSCLPYDPDLRASVSRPIRSGRSAETLISPLRKRGSMSKKHISSPFAGVTKATGRLQSSVTNGRRGPRMGTFS